MKTATTLSNRQQGSTLIEIMVSMFILALGLMALLAMQTRTSAAIKEAENQTRVAQYTENLAEEMMTNPKLILDSNDTKRDYSDYKINKSKCPIKSPSAKGTEDRVDAILRHKKEFTDGMCGVDDGKGGVVGGIDGVDEVAVTVGDSTLVVTWTMAGSSNKQYTYEYPLDNN